MKIAIGGKGGSGKTTIAGTLARALAEARHNVVAIDADSNPNLAATLGIPDEAAAQARPLPRELIVEVADEKGEKRRTLGTPPDALVRDFGVPGPDGIRLLMGGRVGHAGVGCMCRAHANVRVLLSELVGGDWSGREIVVDLEAGLENFSRGTPRHVDAVVAVIEPYFRSMETARRVCELARELDIERVYGLANRVRGDSDRAMIEEFCEKNGIALVGAVPWDDALVEAERQGIAPIDYAADAPAAAEIRRVADVLVPNGRP